MKWTDDEVNTIVLDFQHTATIILSSLIEGKMTRAQAESAFAGNHRALYIRLNSIGYVDSVPSEAEILTHKSVSDFFKTLSSPSADPVYCKTAMGKVTLEIVDYHNMTAQFTDSFYLPQNIAEGRQLIEEYRVGRIGKDTVGPTDSTAKAFDEFIKEQDDDIRQLEVAIMGLGFGSLAEFNELDSRYRSRGL